MPVLHRLLLFEKDCFGRLWIGTDIGLSIMSNGEVTTISELETDQGLINLNDVFAILCKEHHALIAIQSSLIDYDFCNGTASVVRIDHNPVITRSLHEYGDIAVFYDMYSASLAAYNMIEHEVRVLKRLDTPDNPSFNTILRI